MAKPTNDNKQLIDQIIEVTDYEKHFVEYCLSKISETATNETWSFEKTTEVVKKIDFSSFKFTIYNLFAKHTSQELNNLITVYKSEKDSNIKNIIVESEMVNQNLKSYAKNLVGGYK